MRVVDTSAWIEYLAGTLTGHAVQAMLPSPSAWIVPTIVQLELAKWVDRELAAELGASILALSSTYLVAPLTTEIALRAARLGRSHGLATADAIVYATAVELGADLLTCDAHFKGLADVHYVEKR